MSYAVWCSALGYTETPQFPVILPLGTNYTAQSPTLFKNIQYDEDEIWEEIERIASEADGKKFSVGQQLFYQFHFFANPRYLWDAEFDRIIEEYQLMESFNIPLARSLNDAPALKIRDFFIVKDELNFLRKNLMEKNSGR